MNIWYIHHSATPSQIPGMHRPYDIGKYFLQAGASMVVFSSSFLHFNGTDIICDNKKFLSEIYDGIQTVFIKTGAYKKSNIKRAWNMLQFSWRILGVSKIIGEKNSPNIIIASSPHIFALLSGLIIAKRYDIPCICEVRDLWPEELFYVGIVKEYSLLGKFLVQMEKYIYRKANGICFLKEGDHNYIVEKNWNIENGGDIDLKKCIYINNGVDVERFESWIKENVYNDPDLDTTLFKVVYCGTLRPLNDVDMLLDVAKKLDTDVIILIYGQGICLNSLQQRIEEEYIYNVKLKGYVDNKYIPYILSRADATILNYTATGYNWKRGNSSNKLFEYLASGKPVISTIKMGYDILERYGCGISADAYTPEAISDVIYKIKKMPQEKYNEMCRNAKKAAKDFDISKLAKKYFTEIKELVDNTKEN